MLIDLTLLQIFMALLRGERITKTQGSIIGDSHQWDLQSFRKNTKTILSGTEIKMKQYIIHEMNFFQWRLPQFLLFIACFAHIIHGIMLFWSVFTFNLATFYCINPPTSKQLQLFLLLSRCHLKCSKWKKSNKKSK